jgi:hypothetical protein
MADAEAAAARLETLLTEQSRVLSALLAAPPSDDQLAVLVRVLDDRYAAIRNSDRRLWQEALAVPVAETAGPRLRLLRGMMQLNLARMVRGNDCPDFAPAMPSATILGAMSGAARRALDRAWNEFPGDPTVAGAVVSAARALGLDAEQSVRWTGRLLATAPHPMVVHHALLQTLAEVAGDREPNRWMDAVRLCAAADPGRDLPRSAIDLAVSALGFIKPNRGEWRKPEVGAALAAAGAACLARQPADAAALRHRLLGLAWVCRHAPLAKDMLDQLGEPDQAQIPAASEAQIPAIRAWLAELAEKERQRAEKERERAEQERLRREQERLRAEQTKSKPPPPAPAPKPAPEAPVDLPPPTGVSDF